MSAAKMYAGDHQTACQDVYTTMRALTAIGDIAFADGSLPSKKSHRTLDLVRTEDFHCLMKLCAEKLEAALHMLEDSASELERLVPKG